MMQLTYEFTYYTHPILEPGKTFVKAKTFTDTTAERLSWQIKDHIGHYGVISATEINIEETNESTTQV